MKSVEATFHAGDEGSLARVIDDIEAGPLGWSVAPEFTKPQGLVVRSAKPVVAAELDITLFFLSGRANCSIAEFDLAYTTDAEPSLNGNWEPLIIQRYAAEVVNLSRLENGHLRAVSNFYGTTGTIPDDTYRLAVRLPGGRATGFRLRAFPLLNQEGVPYAMSLDYLHDFVLTEFRVEEHVRSTTNIALHCPAKSSQPLFLNLRPAALTDGLPATIAHPIAEQPDPGFHFDIDLGRSVALDHINLLGRGDNYLDRLSQVLVQLYEHDPDQGAKPVWVGMDRADGSHPGVGEHDTLRNGSGKGDFRGRYLRLSTESKVPHSPQIAEVEAYESRSLVLVAAYADGKELPVAGGLNIPPRVKRLSLHFRIPQVGMPRGDLFRWRLPGELDEWQISRTMTLDIPCPPPGRTVFEAQALHSDREWDATLFKLPIIVRQHFWETRSFQLIVITAAILGAAVLSRFVTKRRSARQLALAKAQTALAEERTRIARDIHDDLGARATKISMIADMAGNQTLEPEMVRGCLQDIFTASRELVQAMDETVWVVNAGNDTLMHLAEYILYYSEDFLRRTDLQLTLGMTNDLPAVSLTAETRHNVFMAVKEALHNVVKHAAASEVRVELSLDGSIFRVVIADNGQGFVAELPRGCGDGLANMRQRLEKSGGSCEVRSAPGQGTIVTLELNIGMPPR